MDFSACFVAAAARVGRLGRALLAGVHVALEADEVGLEVRRGLVAEVAVLLERLVEDARRAPAEARD